MPCHYVITCAVATRFACDQAFNGKIVKQTGQNHERLEQEDNVVSEFGKFFLSAVDGHPEIVDYLIKWGSDLNGTYLSSNSCELRHSRGSG